MKHGKQVKNWGNYLICDTGNVFSNRTNKYLSPFLSAGYHRVALYKNGEIWRPSIHRLVALHWINNPEDKPEVNHKDGDKLNNHVDNLEWVTRLENIRHSWNTGIRDTAGKNNGRSKLEVGHVIAIRKIGGTLPSRELAELFGVGQTAILDILHKRTWTHVP